MNSFLLASEHYPLRIPDYDVFLDIMNTCLLVWFFIEMVLRMVGFGLDNYVSDGALCFDGFIVLGSVTNKLVSSRASGMEMFRIFRSLRILLISRGAGQSMIHLLQAVGTCLMRAMDILLINCLTIYLFAIVGMQKFGNAVSLCSEEEVARLGECYTNFSTFFNAVSALVQFSVGQEFGPLLGGIRVDAMNAENCMNLATTEFEQSNCAEEFVGIESFAFFYFSAYYFASVFLCINLFIVSVLDNFVSSQRRSFTAALRFHGVYCGVSQTAHSQDSLTEVDQEINFDHFW